MRDRQIEDFREDIRCRWWSDPDFRREWRDYMRQNRRAVEENTRRPRLELLADKKAEWRAMQAAVTEGSAAA